MKFLFGDKVKVVGGFYQGIEGIVTDYKEDYKIGIYDKSYYFEGCKENDFGAREMRTWITESELEKVDE